MLFQDRADAGRQLAKALLKYKSRQPVILALPRGGVLVAAEVAAVLDAPSICCSFVSSACQASQNSRWVPWQMARPQPSFATARSSKFRVSVQRSSTPSAAKSEPRSSGGASATSAIEPEPWSLGRLRSSLMMELQRAQRPLQP